MASERLTVAQAAQRMEARARQLREEGRWAAAQDWQRDADRLRHLGILAAGLPAVSTRRRPAGAKR